MKKKDQNVVRRKKYKYLIVGNGLCSCPQTSFTYGIRGIDGGAQVNYMLLALNAGADKASKPPHFAVPPP